MSLCASCGEEGTSPKGSKNSKYLLVFNKPYIIAAVRSYKDKLSGLDVLRKELARVGLDIAEFRMCWLNLHEPNKNENCYKVGREIVLDEAKGKQAIVLVGAEPVEEFTGLSASDVYGLQVESSTFSAPIVFVLPKPEGVFVKGAGLGELRLSVEKLARRLENG